jgi:hypothetical protein
VKQLDLFDEAALPPTAWTRNGTNYETDNRGFRYAPLKYLSPGELQELQVFAINHDGNALARMAAELDYHRHEHARWKVRHSGFRAWAIITMWLSVWLSVSVAFWTAIMYGVNYVWERM